MQCFSTHTSMQRTLIYVYAGRNRPDWATASDQERKQIHCYSCRLLQQVARSSSPSRQDSCWSCPISLWAVLQVGFKLISFLFGMHCVLKACLSFVWATYIHSCHSQYTHADLAVVRWSSQIKGENLWTKWRKSSYSWLGQNIVLHPHITHKAMGSQKDSTRPSRQPS